MKGVGRLPKKNGAIPLLALVAIWGCGWNSGSMKEAEPLLARELIGQGTQFLILNDLDRAEASFDVALQVAPIAEALDGLGCVEYLRGNFVSAEHFFVQAIQSDPQYRGVYPNLALLYETLGRREQAKEVYQQALDISPDDFRLRNNFAVFLSQSVWLREREGREIVRRELLGAEALAAHPIIAKNLQAISADEVRREK